jgi:tetratricopeptide (TPR) repeat protein
MRLRLESATAKLVTLAVALALLTPYSVIAWSRYRVARIAMKRDRDSLQRAVDLQPGDATYQERLGRYLLFVDQDAAAAKAHYKLAAALNPYSARTWLGLAQSDLILGNSAEALAAVQRALDADPHTPSVAWESGNLFLALGETQRALQQFRYTLATDPQMLGEGLQLIRRMESPAEAAKVAFPPDPLVYVTFINMLLQSKDINGAKQVWPELLALNKPFDPKLSFYYLSALIGSGDLDSAAQAWTDLEKISPAVARLRRDGNLIHNASFEYPVLNGGFDWLLPGTSHPDPLLQNDISNAHEGSHSLMASFHDTRPGEVGIHQLLILDPNSRFRFTGYIRADLETANGLRFVIIDASSQKRVLETPEVIDGMRWIQLSGEFKTGPEKHLYYLLIERTGTTLVRGNAWIDDLQLVKESE